jgi:hypothetical protein
VRRCSSPKPNGRRFATSVLSESFSASDAGVGGGPYAKVLAEELIKSGIEAVSMFRNVQIRV